MESINTCTHTGLLVQRINERRIIHIQNKRLESDEPSFIIKNPMQISKSN